MNRNSCHLKSVHLRCTLKIRSRKKFAFPQFRLRRFTIGQVLACADLPSVARYSIAVAPPPPHASATARTASNLSRNPLQPIDHTAKSPRLVSIGGLPPRITHTNKASGGSRERPRLEEAMRYVRAGDQLVVTSMDRCARSLTDLYAIVDALVSKGVSVKFLKEG